MRAIYGSKYAVLMEGLKPLTALGWRCSTRGAGMHLLITHDDGEYARRVAAESGVDVATLGSYRRARPRGQDDGLLLRFGGLLIEDIRAAASVWSAPAGRHPESALQN
jgi:DNA-binding transcriptional MocR family regulator